MCIPPRQIIPMWLPTMRVVSTSKCAPAIVSAIPKPTLVATATPADGCPFCVMAATGARTFHFARQAAFLAALHLSSPSSFVSCINTTSALDRCRKSNAPRPLAPSTLVPHAFALMASINQTPLLASADCCSASLSSSHPWLQSSPLP